MHVADKDGLVQAASPHATVEEHLDVGRLSRSECLQPSD